MQLNILFNEQNNYTLKYSGIKMIPGFMGTLVANAVMVVQIYQYPKIKIYVSRREKTMAKERMVTRTIKQTEITCKVANIESETINEHTFIIGGVYKDEKKLMKAAKAIMDDDNYKLISIVSATVKDCLYGMTEAEFIANAKILPDRKAH